MPSAWAERILSNPPEIRATVHPDGPCRVSIRGASPSDALRLHVLATQVFLDTYARSGITEPIAREVSRSLSLHAFESLLAEPCRTVLVAEAEGRLVGFAALGLGRGHGLVGDAASTELERLYVQAPFIGRSVGTALMRAAERAAAEAGSSVLWLTAWVENRRALAFYVNRGYRELGVTQHVFEDGQVENRLFAKSLDGADRWPST